VSSAQRPELVGHYPLCEPATDSSRGPSPPLLWMRAAPRKPPGSRLLMVSGQGLNFHAKGTSLMDGGFLAKENFLACVHVKHA
jgi:hypothetical protein